MDERLTKQRDRLMQIQGLAELILDDRDAFSRLISQDKIAGFRLVIGHKTDENLYFYSHHDSELLLQDAADALSSVMKSGLSHKLMPLLHQMGWRRL